MADWSRHFDEPIPLPDGCDVYPEFLFDTDSAIPGLDLGYQPLPLAMLAN